MVQKCWRNDKKGGKVQQNVKITANEYTQPTFPFSHSMLLKKNTEKRDGVGKKMSEQAPGYFSFHLTQWQYVKNGEEKGTLKFEGGCV